MNNDRSGVNTLLGAKPEASGHTWQTFRAAPPVLAPPRPRPTALYKNIESLLEDVLWNYELVNPLVLRAALDSNIFY